MRKLLLLFFLVATCTGNSGNVPITYATRKTEQYSIEYPNGWKVVEKPDALSDVYIGDVRGNLGLTILYFDSKMKLDAINKEGIKNMKDAGINATLNEKVSIAGCTGFKTVYDFSFSNTECRQISYTLKKDKTVFNIKFGNKRSELEQNEEIIEHIINSFNVDIEK